MSNELSEDQSHLEARIAELEEKLAILEGWAQKTSEWMVALAQQDALISVLLPTPDTKNETIVKQYAELIARTDTNYRALDAFANPTLNAGGADEQSD